MFRPVRSETTTDRVVNQIKELVASGELSPGAKLPGERDLSLRLGVSRTAMREALRILAGLGVVSVQPGRGTFVVGAVDDPGRPAIWMPWLRAHADDLIALLDVREALETKAVYLAAQQPDPATMQRLCANVAAMEGLAESGDVRALEELDIEFHSVLAGMSGNKFLLKLSQSINAVLAFDRRAVFAIPGRAAASAAEHRQIAEAVQAGHAGLAAQIMRAHIDAVKRAVRELNN